ncbi:flagellar motor protein MotB [Thalassotalea euphylliae]|uniref:Chemotaxis protein MotB n=1 Tax=Thalassotalea euphylliae TaxID=1655234 RepID=A0A3E0U0L7_9GAMM|nr:flagellar motor protein MotB [Thalassotalea euphylliae]REL30240.1 chemotaxis protein MotB [Thalassotalea euphylliae]
MSRLRIKRHDVEHDDVHRWLVSYADYMTLLFALFVVLYAMAMINEEPFETVTDSIGRVFQANDELPKNRGHGDDILPVNSSKTNKRLYGDGLKDDAGPELTNGQPILSNIADSDVGTNLTSLEEKLHTALYDIIESGYAQLKIDGDWLEIELNSGLLFPSGSSSPTRSADAILTVINQVLADVTNFVRVRGYTDNQPINNEIFSSNWELSVSRATAILRLLEELGVTPARMAIEGYGQYYPSADNSTSQGRAQNRKVVIAISKYGLDQESLLDTPTISVKDVEAIKEVVDSTGEDNKINIIRLENGAIRITTRNEDETNNSSE